MTRLDEWMAEKGVPVIIADHNGIIQFANKEFQQAYSWESSRIIGRLISTIIPPRFKDAHHMGLSRFLTTEMATLLNQELVMEILSGQGEVLKARHYIIAEKSDGHWMFGARVELMD